MYGWAGKILRINLTKRKVNTELTEKYATRFIGGRGIDQWILFNEVPQNADPFDPRNLLIFGTGPLTGTLAPCSGRLQVDTKNALTGGTTHNNCGGHFAPELKFAGFDHVIIYGKARKPVYIWISDDKAELRDASSIWGKTTWEAEEIIKQDLKDKRIKVADIGPAGENLVRSACIIVDRGRVAGGGGVGAVMGSKKLKALAVRGTKAIKIAEPKEFMEAVDKARSKLKPSGGGWAPYSEAFLQGFPFPVRNAQDEFWPQEKAQKVSGKVSNKYVKRSFACFSCPIGCSRFYEITDGIYANTKCEGFYINTAMAMARLDIDNIRAWIKIHSLLSQLGLDIDNSCVVLSWAFECYQRGVFDKKDTDGLELEWGDYETVITMLKKLAYREGLGNLLADGVKIASEKTGKGSEHYAIHIKGQDTLDRERSVVGWTLGIVTSTRGGRHLDGANTLELRGLSAELGEKYFGISTAGDGRSYDGKAKIVSWNEACKAVVDSIGICFFATGNPPLYWSSYNLLNPEDFSKLVSTATGMKISADKLLRVGKQIYEVEKAFNTIHAGFTRKDDFPPQRYLNEPIKSGPYKGAKIDRVKWEKMLDEYYDIHGYYRETGWQKEETLKELDLDDVAKKLRRSKITNSKI